MGKIDPDLVYEFPEPGTFVPCANISIITPDIPLQLLYSAYLNGVFPWFNEDEGDPVCWYSPEPRFCLRMEDFHVGKTIEKFLKHSPFTYTIDEDFEGVIKGCARMSRKGQNGTWIGDMMINAYMDFHEEGYAHSVEAWHDGKLAGGLYGVLIGSVFCGESMFTVESNSAKSAFVKFARVFADCGGKLIDSQVYTDNIARYGARNISRDAFLRLEQEYLFKPLEKDLISEFRKSVQS